MKLENAKLEAEVKHERQRVEMLQKDLNDSQKVTLSDDHCRLGFSLFYTN